MQACNHPRPRPLLPLLARHAPLLQVPCPGLPKPTLIPPTSTSTLTTTPTSGSSLQQGSSSSGYTLPRTAPSLWSAQKLHSRPPSLPRAKHRSQAAPDFLSMPASKQSQNELGAKRDRIGVKPVESAPSLNMAPADEGGDTTSPRHLQGALPYAKVMVLTHEAFSDSPTFGQETVLFIESCTKSHPISKKLTPE